MNVTQHYREGERLLELAQTTTNHASITTRCALAHAHFAAALVGATLVAGTVVPPASTDTGPELYAAAVEGA